MVRAGGKLFSDFIRAVVWTIRAESVKRRFDPRHAVRLFRAAGAGAPKRLPGDRVRLRRTIRLLDRVFPLGPNCYRRALVEIAMDSSAAAEPLHLGLNVSGRPTGHAWLPPETPERSYEVELRL